MVVEASGGGEPLGARQRRPGGSGTRWGRRSSTRRGPGRPRWQRVKRSVKRGGGERGAGALLTAIQKLTQAPVPKHRKLDENENYSWDHAGRYSTVYSIMYVQTAGGPMRRAGG